VLYAEKNQEEALEVKKAHEEKLQKMDAINEAKMNKLAQFSNMVRNRLVTPLLIVHLWRKECMWNKTALKNQLRSKAREVSQNLKQVTTLNMETIIRVREHQLLSQILAQWFVAFERQTSENMLLAKEKEAQALLKESVQKARLGAHERHKPLREWLNLVSWQSSVGYIFACWRGEARNLKIRRGLEAEQAGHQKTIEDFEEKNKAHQDHIVPYVLRLTHNSFLRRYFSAFSLLPQIQRQEREHEETLLRVETKRQQNILEERQKKRKLVATAGDKMNVMKGWPAGRMLASWALAAWSQAVEREQHLRRYDEDQQKIDSKERQLKDYRNRLDKTVESADDFVKQQQDNLVPYLLRRKQRLQMIPCFQAWRCFKQVNTQEKSHLQDLVEAERRREDDVNAEKNSKRKYAATQSQRLTDFFTLQSIAKVTGSWFLLAWYNFVQKASHLRSYEEEQEKLKKAQAEVIKSRGQRHEVEAMLDDFQRERGEATWPLMLRMRNRQTLTSFLICWKFLPRVNHFENHLQDCIARLDKKHEKAIKDKVLLVRKSVADKVNSMSNLHTEQECKQLLSLAFLAWLQTVTSQQLMRRYVSYDEELTKTSAELRDLKDSNRDLKHYKEKILSCASLAVWLGDVVADFWRLRSFAAWRAWHIKQIREKKVEEANDSARLNIRKNQKEHENQRLRTYTLLNNFTLLANMVQLQKLSFWGWKKVAADEKISNSVIVLKQQHRNETYEVRKDLLGRLQKGVERLAELAKQLLTLKTFMAWATTKRAEALAAENIFKTQREAKEIREQMVQLQEDLAVETAARKTAQAEARTADELLSSASSGMPTLDAKPGVVSSPRRAQLPAERLVSVIHRVYRRRLTQALVAMLTKAPRQIAWHEDSQHERSVLEFTLNRKAASLALPPAPGQAEPVLPDKGKVASTLEFLNRTRQIVEGTRIPTLPPSPASSPSGTPRSFGPFTTSPAGAGFEQFGSIAPTLDAAKAAPKAPSFGISIPAYPSPGISPSTASSPNAPELKVGTSLPNQRPALGISIPSPSGISGLPTGAASPKSPSKIPSFGMSLSSPVSVAISKASPEMIPSPLAVSAPDKAKGLPADLPSFKPASKSAPGTEPTLAAAKSSSAAPTFGTAKATAPVGASKAASSAAPAAGTGAPTAKASLEASLAGMKAAMDKIEPKSKPIP